MTAPAPWQALILAGGRSRRMGRDKAQLPWRGGTLLDHLVDVLRRAGASAVHVSGVQPDGRGIPDRWPGVGPLGGLASALAQVGDGILLALPVDLPLLDPELLAPLLAHADAPAVRFRAQPMPVRLRVDAALRRELQALLDAEPAQRSMNTLFRRLNGIEIECPEGLSGALLNCNTPQEWADAQQRAGVAATDTRG
ncbi:molybdenum cofactor guanylyltransferase [Pseudomarimonas salicorniae]|uniref:Molybdenum cofactor guanylyltransferase n=1 Tax=Pseudomarimonas salicorniae TaxID=2933270 RepID=A0ABT0GG56_9GAMM|nr:molybdenum cofactor guanylyltransferase [Lysobacter sp. CAU 1642]MCK7593189.1 molybdenum cofactor guanylyltransferase [Lysobacter sp. CAU 1642]